MAVIQFAWTFDERSFRHALIDAATLTKDALTGLRELAVNATRHPDPAATRYLTACRFDPTDPEDRQGLSIESGQTGLWFVLAMAPFLHPAPSIPSGPHHALRHMLKYLEAPEGLAETLLDGKSLTSLALQAMQDAVPAWINGGLKQWGGWIPHHEIPALATTLQGLESAFLRPQLDATAALAPAFAGSLDPPTLRHYLRTAYDSALAMLQAGERSGRALRLILD